MCKLDSTIILVESLLYLENKLLISAKAYVN